jgi:hypothetical protein
MGVKCATFFFGEFPLVHKIHNSMTEIHKRRLIGKERGKKGPKKE